MKFKYLHFESTLLPGELVISGSGGCEEMPPGLIDRPGGTGDRLLMFFYHPVQMDWAGERRFFPANTLRLWPCGAGHFYGSVAGKWTHSWLHFHGDVTSGLLLEAGLEEEFCIPFNAAELLEHYLFAIYREQTDQAVPHPRLLHNHLTSLFYEIARARHASTPDPIPREWLALRRFIENHPAEVLDLAGLARQVNRSIPALCAGFRRYFHSSPIRFQLDCRMRLAQYLLRDRNLAIKEIAARCGYADPFQFSRMFHRRFGIAPKNFR